MTDGAAARRGRAACVVAAGRRIADARDPLGQEARRRLPETSGLTPEGVELALGGHLETDPRPEELDALVAGAGRAGRCRVVLAANVCTAPLRALAVAAATAPRVIVRPSRRDPVVAELLVRALGEDARFRELGGAMTLAGAEGPAGGDPAEGGEELHVYGTDATVAALRAQAGPGVVVRGHGTGLGIALVGAGANPGEAARRIAADVIPFDQRGCLSPRVVLVEAGLDAGAVARALHEALGSAGARVPRGRLDAAARAELALYRATAEAIGAWYEGEGHGVGVDPAPRALLLPPPARVLHVAPASTEDAAALVGPWAGVVAAIGLDGDGPLARAVAALAPRARRAPLGRMQRPPLDGPVDLRVR